MKTLLLTLLSTFACVGMAHGATQIEIPDSLTTLPADKMPKISLRNGTGSFSETNLISMESFDGGYVASNVTITNGGFRFYAPDSQIGTEAEDWEMKWYVQAEAGVTPPLEQYFNPLSELSDSTGNQYIALDNGTYDIYYFDQLTTKQHCHLYTYVTPADEDVKLYPPSLYLLSADGSYVELPEVETGVYQAMITLPDPFFKISYQDTGYDVPAFQFGPTSPDVNYLYSGLIRDLTYGTNTYAAFGYLATVTNPDWMLKKGDRAFAKVVLAGDEDHIQIIAEKFTGLSTPDTSRTISTVYNLQGMQLPVSAFIDKTVPAGVYIVGYTDGATDKVMVH